jgi:hypothetical protein
VAILGSATRDVRRQQIPTIDMAHNSVNVNEPTSTVTIWYVMPK